MQLTKGAIGNLINRYRAVLKKCHLLNVFGSLAVAGMLVMGGAAAAGAAEWNPSTDPNLTVSEGESVVIGASHGITSEKVSIQITGGNLSISETGNIVDNSGQSDLSMSGGSITINGGNKDGLGIIQVGDIDISGGTLTIGPRDTANTKANKWDDSMLLAYNSSKFSGKDTVINIDGGTSFNGLGDETGTYISQMRFEDGVQVNLSGQTLDGAAVIKASPAQEGVGGTHVVFDKATVDVTGYAVIDAGKTTLENGTTFTVKNSGNLNLACGMPKVTEAHPGSGYVAMTTVEEALAALPTDKTGTFTITSGASLNVAQGGTLNVHNVHVDASDDGSINNSGTINVNGPDSSISDVTFERGEKTADTGLFVINADGSATLNGGMNTGEGATAHVDSVTIQEGKVTLKGIAAANNDLAYNSYSYKNAGVVSFGLKNPNDATVDVTVTDSAFTNNTVTATTNLPRSGQTTAGGAAISFDANDGTAQSELTISRSEFSGNTFKVTGDYKVGGAYGGAIGVQDRVAVTLTDVTLTNNTAIGEEMNAQGGGYYQSDYKQGASLTATNLTVTDNTAEGKSACGGGMALFGVEDGATINNSTFIGNTANGTKESMGGALFTGETGGKISVTTVTNSTFTGNKAEGAAAQGGAIYNSGELTVNGGEFTGNSATRYGGAIADSWQNASQTDIKNSIFKTNTAQSGGAIALWSPTEEKTSSIISTIFEGNNADKKGGAIAILSETVNYKANLTINGGTFTGNTAGESGGALHLEHASVTITDATFTSNHATQQGGAIYNAANSSISFSGTNTFTDNTAAEGNDIYNAGSITVADGTTTLGSGLTQAATGTITVNGGTLDMASGSSLSFAEDSKLTINGGTFVADASLLVTDNGDSIYQANTNKGISDTSIVGTDGNLNLRWFDGDYTADEYASVKQALMASVGENAALNFLNANLKLDEGQDLVVGAAQEDNGVVTIQTAPVVVEETEAPSAAADKVITSVPNQIVSVVAADDNNADKQPLAADTIIVSSSKFTAKGLEIAGTASAEAVTLKVTDSSDITLTGGEAGFTGVVANNDNVATDVVVENASLTVGLEGNASAQNLTLNEVTVDGGTFAVAGNGLDTTQVEASTLTTKESGTVAVNNATLAVENAVVKSGLLNITNAVADLGTVQATGGVLFFDPSYGNIRSLENDQLGSKLLVSDGSVVNVASGLDNLQELAQKAGFTTTATGSGEFTLGAGQSMLAVGQPIQLTSTGQIVVDAGVDASGNISSSPVSQDAYFGNNSLLVVNGNTINGTTAAIDLANTTNKDLYVQNGAKLLIADAVAGTTYTIIDGEDNTSKAFNGGAYADPGTTGWKGSNLLTSSDMVTLTSEDGTVFKSVSADAHTVFPNLSHELATAVNTLYGQQLNDVDADAMGVRFLSRATDNRYLGADKQAAASTIESAARMAFAGAVPQMTRMASDAGTNAVVNRLGFANPADGAQAMNAEGKIVDRNTTGFALWIAPLWQNQHGWGMEAGNLDYGFNGNLGGVSLGADYTFENAIRAGITFNIGGGYAESSGGDLNSTENRMTFWGLGAYAGWNYENFGLMADVSYTSTWNDLEQDMDGRMGMGDLEADVQATAISAGLRAEYKLETSVLDIIPHIGVRYMSLNTWGYDVDTNGGTVLEGDGFHQDIWTFPIGVTFSKDFTLDSGWFFKPSVDFSVIPAAGDIKAKQDVAFTGLPGTYEVETQMMDYLTWQGGVGIQMGNDNLSFGVNYTLQAGQNTTGHGVFGSFRYEF